MRKMIIIAEAFIIGVISLFLYLLLNLIVDNLIIQLFLLGFFKHYLSYVIGLQSFYCKFKLNNNRYQSKPDNIIFESILEGLIFVYLGLLLTKIITNKFILIFTLGFIIHIIAEFYGVHEIFLKYNCSLD